jgi:protein-S-isoprenylcysteine O-methyltransferase Ste14
MSKTTAILGSALFFVVAPLLLAGFVPWWITRWELAPTWSGSELIRVAGAMLIAAGAPGLVDSFARFALQGLGTPAPVAPTRTLVVTGLYRYVRNPIYISVASVILGQALLLCDGRLLVYGALFWLACHVFVVVYEEPTLLRTFGSEYEVYRANVRRWLPRLRPWQPANRLSANRPGS